MDPDFIEDLREFLKNQADAEFCLGSGDAIPNDAMRLLMQLDFLFPEPKP